MKRHFALIIVILGLTVNILSCTSQEEPHPVLKNLANHWTVDLNDPEATQEHWAQDDEGWKGRGFTLSVAGDTTFVEYLALREVGGKLTYFARVPTQNESAGYP